MAATLEDLVELALFARVVEAKSFTDAAKKLGLSKSVVSTRVARLEDRLGVRLLQRTTRRLSLTEAGLRVYDGASRLVAIADETALVAEDAGPTPRGTLRVNAPVTFAQLYLAPLVAEFLRKHPGVRVDLVASDGLVDLLEEGFDVAIRITRLRDSSLVARKLGSDRLLVFGAPSYLERMGTPEKPEDLLHHNCLRYSRLPAKVEWRFHGKDGPYSVPVSGSFVASDGTVLTRAAVAGLGLAVLPRFMAAADVAAGRLRTVLDAHRRAEVGIYAVHPHRRHVPTKVRAFVDFLATRLEGGRLALPG